MHRSLPFAFLLLPLAAAAEPPAPLTAIKAGRLLDMAAQKARESVVIVVEAGRVKEIVSSVPPGATLIDLGSQTVLPGYIDGHTHVLLQGDATADDYDAQLLKESLAYRALRAARAMRIALGHGFTTLRDIGNEGAGFVDVDLKRAVEAGILGGPRLFVATKALAPTGAYGLFGLRLGTGRSEGRRDVRRRGRLPPRGGTRSRTAPTGSRSTPTAPTTGSPTARSAAFPTSPSRN